MTDRLQLILGGARSGKSRIAESRARESGLNLVYIATATAGDDEMQKRIQRHAQDRAEQGVSWFLIEEPLDLAAALRLKSESNNCILIDCLTLWISNCLHQGCWPEQKKRFIEALGEVEGQVLLVSNETGLGVVPMGEISRAFVDESGFLHQELGRISDRVTLIVAGLATELKERIW